MANKQAGSCIHSKVVEYILKSVHVCVHAQTNAWMCVNVYFLPPKKMPCARNMGERRNEKEVASIIIGHMHYTHSMRTWNDSCMPFISAAFCLLLLFLLCQAKAMLFRDYPFHNCILRLHFFRSSSLKSGN